MGVAAHEQFEDFRSRVNIRLGLGGLVRLFKNDFTPTRSSVLADFVEADFSGYIEKNPTSLDTSNATLNRHEAVMSSVSFQHNGGAESNIVYGWYMVSSIVDVFQKFDTEKRMATADDRIDIDVKAYVEMKP